MNQMFAYINEEDKSYGLAGIAISLNVWDKHDVLRQMSLDEEESISFVPEFFVCSNPRMSAKSAWNDMVEQYQVLMGMTISNILCRNVVLKHSTLSKQLKDAIYQLAQEQGSDQCSLEEDEIDMIFNKTYNYLSSIYVTIPVANAARRFAQALIERRTMSGTEVEEEMQRCLRR